MADAVTCWDHANLRPTGTCLNTLIAVAMTWFNAGHETSEDGKVTRLLRAWSRGEPQARVQGPRQPPRILGKIARQS